MQLLLQHHYQEDYWGIPIIDVSNVFNDENQTSMMWEVWYEWPSDIQYTFKFYRPLRRAGDSRRRGDRSLPLHQEQGDPRIPLVMI